MTSTIKWNTAKNSISECQKRIWNTPKLSLNISVGIVKLEIRELEVKAAYARISTKIDE